MTFYRRYKALFEFVARTDLELSMSQDDTLLVEPLADGSWPPAEKWMQGYNEATSKRGEFPGGAYVEFLEEFVVEPEPQAPPLPPQPSQSQAPPLPPQPSPRSMGPPKGFQLPPIQFPGRAKPVPVASQGFDSQADNDTPDNDMAGYRDGIGAGGLNEEEETPPTPPPRGGIGGRRLSEDHKTHPTSQRPVQLNHDHRRSLPAPPPPRPAPRPNKRPSAGDVVVTTPIHGSLKEERHNWIMVTFGVPMQCVGCDDYIWGSSNPGCKCEVCLSTCHKICHSHVAAKSCVPMDDRHRKAQLDYIHLGWRDWTEQELGVWMKAVNISVYQGHFQAGGVVRGCDLQNLDDSRLREIGIEDDLHRLVIVECLNELINESSTIVATLAYDEEPDGSLNRLSAFLPRSPSLQSVHAILGNLGQKKGDTQSGGHDFGVHSFSAQWCDVCGRFLWGLFRQGMKCKVCGMSVHRMCMTDSIVPCDHWTPRREMSSFGVDLSVLFQVEEMSAPAVVLKTIEAVEAGGLGLEGLYRVSPPLHALNSLREALDTDPLSVNPQDSRWDQVVFSAALKLFLRSLPNPVIPFELYSRFMDAAKLPGPELCYSQLQPLLEHLPPHHYSTLDTILTHLARVVTQEHQNKMSAENLALVFGPSLVHPKSDQVEIMVENSAAHCRVVEVLLTYGPWAPPPPPRPLSPDTQAPPIISRKQKPHYRDQQPVLPPRPHSAGTSSTPAPPPRPLYSGTPSTTTPPPRPPYTGRHAVPNPYSFSTDESIYEEHEANSSDGGGLGYDYPPPVPMMSSVDLGPLEEQGWYWGDIDREDVVNKLCDTPDGTFMVRNSRRAGEYTLTVRKGGANKLIRIISSNGKYGFSEPTGFDSVAGLVDYFRRVPLTKYNARLDVTLISPISRYSQVDDDDDEEADETMEEDGERGPAPETDTDKANMLLQKLQDLTEIFESKNEDYQAMEETSEKLRKKMEESNKILQAHTQVMEMIKDHLQMFDTKKHSNLSKSDQRQLMENAKLVGQRRLEAEKHIVQANRFHRETNVEYRTMDKDINTVRPQLMKLQRNKDEYIRKLLELGWTKEYINQMVKEKAVSESESIYGTLYGTLGEEQQQENIDNDEELYEAPEESEPSFPSGPVIPPEPSFSSGPGIPPREHSKPRPRPPPPIREQPLPPQPGLSPPPPITPNPRASPNLPRRPKRSDYEGMDLNKPPKERMGSLPASSMNEVRPVHPRSASSTIQGRSPVSLPSKPHEKRETWFCEVDRVKSVEMLKGKKNGTFLCRPTSKQNKLFNGELHTHTVDVVYNGQKHLKVVQKNNMYGFSSPCTSPSLMELVLFYSENSLVQHNPGLTTTLEHPINA